MEELDEDIILLPSIALTAYFRVNEFNTGGGNCTIFILRSPFQHHTLMYVVLVRLDNSMGVTTIKATIMTSANSDCACANRLARI